MKKQKTISNLEFKRLKYLRDRSLSLQQECDRLFDEAVEITKATPRPENDYVFDFIYNKYPNDLDVLLERINIKVKKNKKKERGEVVW